MLRFMDGFDHYATAKITEKWTTITASPSISAGNGRRGTQSLRMASNTAATKTLDAQSSWVVGFAFRPSTVAAAAMPMVSFLDAGTAQCDLRLNTDFTLSVTRNGTVVTGGTS